MNNQAQIGIAGLAVMGENLVLNMVGKGISVTAYNRTTARVNKFLAGRAKGKPISGSHTIADFVQSLTRPRKIMMMLKAGEVMDNFIEQLLPYLLKATSSSTAAMPTTTTPSLMPRGRFFHTNWTGRGGEISSTTYNA